MTQEKFSVPLSIVVSREGKWFVASCPILDIATQGETEEEVKDNIKDLIQEYFKDPDTKKPNFQDLMSSSVSVFNLAVKLEDANGKAQAVNSN